jgi:predicted acylesterase/phospholipase RssA
MAPSAKPKERKKKRAIALAGGGPAAGFHIGALAALEECGVNFDVWSLSCIGAWVGTYYNQLTPRNRAARTYEFFKENAFRDTASYRGFPVNKAFAPHLQAYTQAWLAHSLNPQTYLDVFGFAKDLPSAAAGWSRFLMTPAMWFREGDRNAHVLNDVLAVNPMSRFLTSMAYLSGINGLSNIYYPDSTFLDSIQLEALDLVDEGSLDLFCRAQLAELVASYENRPLAPERLAIPEIYHNALPLTSNDEAVPRQIQLFNNKWLSYRLGKNQRDYLPITRPSLCACSALPYVEQTVKIPNDDGKEYSEGALVDTVNFRNLVEDHPDLDEIWVCRIVDYRQVRLQHNLHDSLGNLCEQFAAEVGENDIELFKTHLRKSTGRTPRVVEIPLQPKTKIGFRWDHENLENGRAEGYRAVKDLVGRQAELTSATTTAPEWLPA